MHTTRRGLRRANTCWAGPHCRMSLKPKPWRHPPRHGSHIAVCCCCGFAVFEECTVFQLVLHQPPCTSLSCRPDYPLSSQAGVLRDRPVAGLLLVPCCTQEHTRCSVPERQLAAVAQHCGMGVIAAEAARQS